MKFPQQALLSLFFFQRSFPTSLAFARASAAATNNPTTTTTSCAMSTITEEEGKVAQSFTDVSPAYKELIAKLNLVTQLRRAEAVLDYDRTVVGSFSSFFMIGLLFES